MDAFFQIIEDLDEAVYFLTPQRVITYWNRSAEMISGYQAQEVIGKSCKDNILVHVDANGTSLCKNRCPVMAAIESGSPQKNNVYLHHKDGHRVPIRVKVYPVRDERGVIVGAFELFADKSVMMVDRGRLQEYIRHSYIDEETDLYNRRYFAMKVPRLLAETRETSGQVAVIAAYVENFFSVGRELGRDIAGAVMKMTVKTINSALNADSAYLFSWGVNRIVVVIPKSNKTALLRYPGTLEMLLKQSFITVGKQKVSPKVHLEWFLVDSDASVDMIINRIDTIYFRENRTMELQRQHQAAEGDSSDSERNPSVSGAAEPSENIDSGVKD